MPCAWGRHSAEESCEMVKSKEPSQEYVGGDGGETVAIEVVHVGGNRRLLAWRGLRTVAHMSKGAGGVN